MLETQFSLSWEQHMYNISYGLSKFRQNGEFVDMTLATEGYFLKAHRMILSLVSPYIKDIIASLECTHPVIFLNNVSYKTLCSILDYVYKGEVQVTKEQLEDLIKVGKVLQIKGLQEMTSQTTSNSPSADANVKIDSISNTEGENEMKAKLEALVKSKEQIKMIDSIGSNEFDNQGIVVNEDGGQNHGKHLELSDGNANYPETSQITGNTTHSDNVLNSSFIIDQDSNDVATPLFTISNQGSLQLVLNSHLYFLKYNSTSASGHTQWKCVNYVNKKCPAYVITKSDKVIQKLVRHSHPSHDFKLAKKVASGEMFSTMKDAEEFAKSKKDTKPRHNRGKKSHSTLA